jgi:uncharacterized membrane protein SpoIIM required for sporulation
MNEIRFIKLNGKRWQDFDNFLNENEISNPDQLAQLYVELTDDLAYARTFFPNSKTTKYLNQITFKAHQQIFKRRKVASNSIIKFFLNDYPLTIYENRKTIFIAFIFFVISAIIGAASLSLNEDFARSILGDGYVNMTIDNIKDGHPMGVYDSQEQGIMFLSIAWNNIRVAFMAFALGIFFTVGTFTVLLRNGIMLGVFQFFFFKYGLMKVSFLTVWMHGTIEISSIIIAAAAGIVMGKGFLFPGTYPRIYSLQREALKGVKMVIGLIPLFIIAAFIESFVTRHSEVSFTFDAIIIVLSSIFIISYLFVYPYFLTKKLNYD